MKKTVPTQQSKLKSASTVIAVSKKDTSSAHQPSAAFKKALQTVADMGKKDEQV